MHNKSTAGLDNFINKCDELMNSKFIIAGSKIAELLNSIASCDMLYTLFQQVTEDFNYAEHKKLCLTHPGGGAQRGVFRLPEGAKDTLAFIFCLLMEIDSGAVDLSSLIMTYFYTDGSYFESFYEFCNRVIKPFKNITRAAAEELYGTASQAVKKPAFYEVFQGEKYRGAKEALNTAKETVISDFTLSAEEKTSICDYIDGLLSCVLAFDRAQLSRMLTGFKYISQSVPSLTPSSKKIIKLLKGDR